MHAIIIQIGPGIAKLLELGEQGHSIIEGGPSQGDPEIEGEHSTHTPIDAFEFILFVLDSFELRVLCDSSLDLLLYILYISRMPLRTSWFLSQSVSVVSAVKSM